MAQTCVRRAKVIDRPDRIHPVMQRQWATYQCPASPRQHRQTLAERRVQPLAIGRVDHAVAVRATLERLDARWCASYNTAFDVDHTPLHIALDNLRNTDVFPGTQLRASMGACPHRITKRLADGPYIGAQAVDTDQERAGGCTAAYPLNEAPNQRHVAVGAQLASQPQPRADHPRQCHPDNAPLFFHTDLIRLDRSQVTRVLDQPLVDSLPLSARSRQPICHRPLIKAKGSRNGLWRTTMCEQGHDNHHDL